MKDGGKVKLMVELEFFQVRLIILYFFLYFSLFIIFCNVNIVITLFFIQLILQMNKNAALKFMELTEKKIKLDSSILKERYFALSKQFHSDKQSTNEEVNLINCEKIHVEFS